MNDAMKIQLTLNKSLITEAVKAETYLRGNYVKATDQSGSTTTVGYRTQAGDDEVDERKVDRDIRYATEKLKTVFVDYITPSATVKGDDMVDSVNDANQFIIYNLTVSQRWNGTLTDACARLSSRYIQDCATMLWYQAIGDKQQTEYYALLLKNDEAEVRKCFIKSPPEAPSLSYSTKIQFQQPLMTDGSLHLIEGDEEIITYTLDDGAIDDIETRSEEPSIVRTYLNNEGKFVIKALRPGVSTIVFFSRHHDDVRASFDCIVMSDLDKESTDQHYGPDPIFPHHPYR